MDASGLCAGEHAHWIWTFCSTGKRNWQTSGWLSPIRRMTQRNFVLYPLLEIAPANLMLPGGKELGTLVDGCPPVNLEKTPLQLAPGHTGRG